MAYQAIFVSVIISLASAILGSNRFDRRFGRRCARGERIGGVHNGRRDESNT